MSRLVRKPIPIPDGVTVSARAGGVVFKGPKGEYSLRPPKSVSILVEPTFVKVASLGEDRQASMNAGTFWSLAKNGLHGVASGFSKTLEIEGVGYRASMEGKTLVLALGYVKPVAFEPPEGVSIAVSKNAITVSGVDKELVGRAASEIRSLKKPEPYKGKGIRYQGEIIRRKAGKKAAAAGATAA